MFSLESARSRLRAIHFAKVSWGELIRHKSLLSYSSTLVHSISIYVILFVFYLYYCLMIRPVPLLVTIGKTYSWMETPGLPVVLLFWYIFPIEVNVLVNFVNLASCMLYDVITQLTPYLTWLWIALSDYNGDLL